MKKFKIPGLLLVVGLLAVSLSAQSLLKRTTTKNDKFDFGSGGTVAITGAPMGSIRVTGSNKNEIEITAQIELQASTAADLARLEAVTGFVTEEAVGRTGIISIGTNNRLGDKKLWKKFPKDLLSLPFRIDYVISVPHYCDLEIDGGKGDLTIENVEGSIRVNFVETNATIPVLGGSLSVTVGTGKVNVNFGVHGWRAKAANVQVGTGDLSVLLPPNTSADIDATILRTGKIENTIADLKPRDRKVPFTDKSIIAKKGVGGIVLKFVVGDGTLLLDHPKFS